MPEILHSFLPVEPLPHRWRTLPHNQPQALRNYPNGQQWAPSSFLYVSVTPVKLFPSALSRMRTTLPTRASMTNFRSLPSTTPRDGLKLQVLQLTTANALAWLLTKQADADSSSTWPLLWPTSTDTKCQVFGRTVIFHFPTTTGLSAKRRSG